MPVLSDISFYARRFKSVSACLSILRLVESLSTLLELFQNIIHPLDVLGNLSLVVNLSLLSSVGSFWATTRFLWSKFAVFKFGICWWCVLLGAGETYKSLLYSLWSF